MAYLKSDEEKIGFEKVNNMVEFLQCYPLEVRKNKNASAQMEDVLHMTNREIKQKPVELNDASKLMMFVWGKLCD
mgnify:CR=1 FL=1